MVRRRALVQGRVQGVFYRDTLRREALRRGVHGFARNLPDGRVELELEGDDEAVQAVIGYARAGPSRAVVTQVIVDAIEPTGATGFAIR